MLHDFHYQNAVRAQDACNLSGVVEEFNSVLKEIWKEAHKHNCGTEWVNKHPIAVLYASKIASLTCCEDSDIFHKAYMDCVNKSGV